MTKEIDSTLVAAVAALSQEDTETLIMRADDRRALLGQQFKVAIEQGELATAQRLLNQGASLGQSDASSLGVLLAESADPEALSRVLDMLRIARPAEYGTFAVRAIKRAVEIDAVGPLRVALSHIEKHDDDGTILSAALSLNSYFYSINGMAEAAAEKGSVRVLDFMLSQWDDIEQYEYPARLVKAAANSGNNDVIKCVLDSRVQDRGYAFQTGLMVAAHGGNAEGVRLFLDAGTEIGAPSGADASNWSVVNGAAVFDWNTILSAATRDGSRPLSRGMAELALSRAAADTRIASKVFYWAVMSGSHQAIDVLSEQGVDVAGFVYRSHARVELGQASGVVDALMRACGQKSEDFGRAVGSRVYVRSIDGVQPLLEDLEKQGVDLDGVDFSFACGSVTRATDLPALEWIESKGVDLGKHASRALDSVVSRRITASSLEAPVAKFWLDRGAKVSRDLLLDVDGEVMETFGDHDRAPVRSQPRMA